MVPRYRSKGFVYSVILLVFQTIAVSCNINMCTNGTKAGSSVFVFKTNDDMVTDNCHCTINAANGTKIIFHTEKKLESCGLKLAVMYTSYKSYYSCVSHNPICYTISNDEKIELRLEPNNSSPGKFEFGFKLSSPATGPPTPPSSSTGTPIRTDTCLQSTTSSATETPASTERSTQTNTSLQSTTTGSPKTSLAISTLPKSLNTPISSPSTTVSYPIPPENASTTYIPPTSETILKPQTSEQSSLPGIVGGSVTAIVVIVILIIIVVCVLKRRKNKSRTQSPAKDADYCDNGVTNNTYDNSLANVRYGNLVITDNDLYVSSGDIENNGILSNVQNHNATDITPAKINYNNMEITDNDMYASPDDIENGNLPKTQAPKLTILSNNTQYQSIDSLDQNVDQPNGNKNPRSVGKNYKPPIAPKPSIEPEYATVNKTQKPQGSEIDKPKGDNSYAKRNDSSPNGDNSNSKGDNSNPNKGDNSIFNGNDSNPNEDNLNSKGDNLNHKGDNSNPKEDDSNSKDDESNSKEDNSDTQANDEGHFTGPEGDCYTLVNKL